MAHRVTLIPGDGIGPEVSEATRRVLESTGVKFDWDVREAGLKVAEAGGNPMPESVLDSIRANRVGLKGPITTPVGKGWRSVNVSLRQGLELFACVRPCVSFPGVRSRFENLDLVIVRENTEGLYTGIEFEPGSPGAMEIRATVRGHLGREIPASAGLTLKYISQEGSERIVRHAFEYARRHHRRRVTAVHKANIMKVSDGLFLRVAREVAMEFPEITYDERIIDNMCMQLVQHPERYDVLVLPNLYGDVVSDLAAGLVGGLGVAPGANLGPAAAVFEPTHGTAPDIAGRNLANPMAMILSGAMMLNHLGEHQAGARVVAAVAAVIREGRTVTADMKADPADPTSVGTREVADGIIAALRG